jgi:hypothetical protein
MASIFKKEPIFLLERTWVDKTKLPEKFKFLGTAGKAEVHIDSGSLGMEFFYKKTFPDFMQAGTKLVWSWRETFSEFENVLAGGYKTAWREILNDHFSEQTASEASKDPNNQQNGFDEAGFHQAVKLFVCKILDSLTPRNLQYIYMALGGGHKMVKDLLTPPQEHMQQFKEMLRVAKLLPAGKMPKPNKKLAFQWYYMTYHCTDHAEYVKSGKKLSAKTFNSLTGYFQALLSQKKMTARSNVPRLITCVTAQRSGSQATFARSGTHAGRVTRDGSSRSRNDATKVGCIDAIMGMIATNAISPTIGRQEVPTMDDWDAETMGIATIHKTVVDAMRVASAERNGRATGTARQRRQIKHGHDATIIAATRRRSAPMSGVKNTRPTTLTIATRVAMTRVGTMAPRPSRAAGSHRPRATMRTILPWRWKGPPKRQKRLDARPLCLANLFIRLLRAMRTKLSSQRWGIC